MKVYWNHKVRIKEKYSYICDFFFQKKIFWLVKKLEFQKTKPTYTITYKSRLTQKKLYKKTDAIFSIYGRNGINP